MSTCVEEEKKEENSSKKAGATKCTLCGNSHDKISVVGMYKICDNCLSRIEK